MAVEVKQRIDVFLSAAQNDCLSEDCILFHRTQTEKGCKRKYDQKMKTGEFMSLSSHAGRSEQMTLVSRVRIGNMFNFLVYYSMVIFWQQI